MRSSLQAFPAACLSLLLVSAPALAQDAGTKSLAKLTQVKEPGPGATPIEPTASIDFKGGTLADYIAAIDKAFGGSNTAVQPGLETLPVGPVKLVEVRRKEAVRAVEVLARPTPGMAVAVASGGEPEVFRIFSDRRPEPPAPEIRVNVWTLSPVLENKTGPEQALSAIEVALAMVPGTANIKYHQDTQLLIISGTEEHARAVSKVIGAMHEARAAAEKAAHRPSAESLKALEDENQSLRRQVADLEIRLRAANDKLSNPAR